MFADLSALIEPNPPTRAYGASVFDADGDGRPEVFVCGFGGPNRVFKWLDGKLRDITPTALADDGKPTLCAAAGDVDGDGREELYVLHSDTYSGPKKLADRLWDFAPTGRWVDLFERPQNRAARNLAAGRSVACVDRRGSGRYGFITASYDRPLKYFELSAEGVLVDIASAIGLDATCGGRGLVVGPLASPRPDVFLTAENGPNRLFRNTGVGTFLEATAAHRLDDAAEQGRGAALLDADGDGRLDVAWGNWDGPHRLMVRRPDGAFKDRATFAMAMPSQIRTVLAADFDNDGCEELFFNNIAEPNRLFRTIPPDWFLGDCGVAVESDLHGTGAVAADFDGDGVLELLVCHGELRDEPLSLFRAAAPASGWLRVAPLTRFGAPARGAVVTLEVAGRTKVRVICGGSGYLCQGEPVAHFGLGELEVVERVGVVWPDGQIAEIAAPRTKQILSVPFPS
jgi:hypothetical protein